MKHKYKVCVYAICRNEESFVNRWYESMKEADEIYVLDTGSTDDTVKKLEELNVFVTKKEISPWRFDVARNESLSLVPMDTDICVCTDLDEIFTPGWRDELEKVWDEDTTRVRYNYNWNFDKYGNPDVNFYIEKIHSRNGYKWTHPVHEVLKYEGDEVFKTTDSFTLNHYPDKNKSRSSYLPLLELSVKEEPLDDRNMHYLGREYMYYGMWNESIDTLIKHLELKSATWKDERAASMRFISRCYINLKRYREAEMWLNYAINEAPYLRDGYVEMAMLMLSLNRYKEVIDYCKKALEINSKNKTYINETFSYNYTIYDLMANGYFYLGNYDDAYNYSIIALEMDPDNERLKNNRDIILKYKMEAK